MNNKNIVILIPFFAKSLPEYFDLYLNSVQANKQLEIYFFSNIDLPNNLPQNFTSFKMNLGELNILIREKTKTKINIINPYKLCDLKPLYGKIFEDYIKDFDYWAFGDIDLIYGDLAKFINGVFDITKYDIVSFREHWISGSLCFFKNSKKINELYKLSKDWEMMLTNSDKYYGFDEVSRKTDRTLIFSDLVNGIPLNSIKTEIESFTHVVMLKKHGVKTFFKTMIKESISPKMILKYQSKSIKIYQNIVNLQDTADFAFYHFITEKKSAYFSFPTWSEIPENFYISQYGFHENLNNLQRQFTIRKLKAIILKIPPMFYSRIKKKISKILFSV